MALKNDGVRHLARVGPHGFNLGAGQAQGVDQLHQGTVRTKVLVLADGDGLLQVKAFAVLVELLVWVFQ